MLFSSVPFLYYFLPLVLLVYFAMPRRGKNAVLLVFSLVFYGWGEPKYLALMAASIGAGYLFGLLIGRRPKSRWGRVWLIASLAVSLGLLGWFKYAGFTAESLNALGLSLPLPKVTLPIGISFYTFQIISYTIDVYRGEVPAQKNLIHFGAYVSMFPQLIAGPIVRYSHVAAQLERREHSLEKAAAGSRRFLIGLSKKVLLANQLGRLVSLYRETAQPSVLFAWLYALAFALQLYFDFSGYSDMAIGLGKIFGFDLMENFNYPFLSRSVSEFWRRWHISLGGWFRDYLYIPLGGSRVGPVKWCRNLLAVWALTGLWHGAAWNFVAWGLLFAFLLAAEKLWLGEKLARLPGWLARIPVLLAVLFSFVIFNAGSLAQAGQDLSALLGLSGLPLASGESLHALRTFGPLLLMAAVGSTPAVKKAASGLCRRRWMGWLEPVGLCLLLLAVTAFLADGSFNPFLYFRF